MCEKHGDKGAVTKLIFTCGMFQVSFAQLLFLCNRLFLMCRYKIECKHGFQRYIVRFNKHYGRKHYNKMYQCSTNGNFLKYFYKTGNILQENVFTKIYINGIISLRTNLH